MMSAVNRDKLGRKVLAELEQFPVDCLLGSCLAAVEAGLEPAGLVLKQIEIGGRAKFVDGISGATVREADAYLYENAESFGMSRLIVTARLVVDLGEPGDTAMQMYLQLAAQRETGPEFLLSRRMHAELNRDLAEDMNAHALIEAGLARLAEISGGVEELCKRLALQFCKELADELTP